MPDEEFASISDNIVGFFHDPAVRYYAEDLRATLRSVSEQNSAPQFREQRLRGFLDHEHRYFSIYQVGFGDVYPRTIFGRFYMVICALNGVFIISMMVLSIINTFVFDTLESRTYTVTTKVIQKKLMKQRSEMIIKKMARVALKKTKKEMPTSKEILEIKEESRAFQKINR